jgi:D-glycero-D-manno-heptose 1,7-bisphosphate phosphatase
MRAAVFLDRDGTLTHARHYPSRPEQLVLQDGVPAALHALQDSGFLLVVVTNQSGLGRGYFTAEDLDTMHAHLRDQLAAFDVRLDGIYHCPHHPDAGCRCRKPEPGMLITAAAELGIDLAASWMVGDFLSDIEAGKRAGCRTGFVGYADAGADIVMESTASALVQILAATRVGVSFVDQ